MPFSWQIVSYVLKAALRDKIIAAQILFFILITNLAIFSGSSAIIESSAFATVFAAGGLRLAGVAGLVLFICFFIRRSFESGDIDLMLSRPFGRGQLVFSYAFAFFILAVFIALAEGLAIYSLSGSRFGEAHILWVVSIAVENIIVVMAALFFAMVLSSAPLCVLAGFSLYLLSRLIGQFLGIVQMGEQFYGSYVLGYVMKAVSLVVPRLDLMGQTSWLIYGVEPGAPGFFFVILQGILFTFLVYWATLVDLKRRQF